MGVRELKQNASAVVAEAASGEVITITDRGRPVAHMIPLLGGRRSELVAAGRLRPARRAVKDLPPPPRSRKRRTASQVLQERRDDERY